METKYKGFTIKILQDTCPDNPRTEYENVGTILFSSNRYVLGDKNVTKDHIEEIIQRDDVIYLPVYAYIHGSIMLSVDEFGDRFDSGMSGIIYCEKSKAIDEFGQEGYEEKVKECFKAEIKAFSKYLEGEIYGYYISEPSQVIEESCYGFYSEEEALQEAKLFVDSTDLPIVCSQMKKICTGVGSCGC